MTEQERVADLCERLEVFPYISRDEASAELKAARKALGMTQSALAEALRLSPKNGDRSVRIWEQEGNTVPGPVQVAVEYMLAEAGTETEWENR